MDNLQTDLNRLGEWAVENEMRINPDKSKAVSFTKARLKERVRYYFGEQLIPEENSFKYIGIIIRNDLNWADHANYTIRKARKALYFIMRILKKGNNNTKRLAYTALVRPTLEYGAVCWDHTERCVGTIQSGVLGPYRVALDHTERCVVTIQSGVLGPYRAVCWDHTERCVGTIQRGVLRP